MFKRALDLLGAAAGLTILAPFFALIGLAILLESPGPIFFRQVRVGRYGAPFRIFKFRTMTGAEPAAGPILTIGDNPRITKLGKVLRDWKIDELPQLVNVLIGDMSLVGPRPEVQKYVDRYTPEQRGLALSVRPGLTGPASLKYRNQTELLARYADPEDAYIKVVMQEKLRLNMDYIPQATFVSDLKLIFQTIFALFRRAAP